MDMNHVSLVGRLAADVEFSPGKEDTSARCVGRLCINRPANNDGERKSDYIQIVAWGKLADNFAKYTSSGKEIGVIGAIRVNNIKENGVWKNYFEVLAQSISFGHDSNQAKMMKALGGGSDVIQKAVANFGGGAEGVSALLANPDVQKMLATMKQAAAPVKTPQTNTVPLPIIEEESLTVFTDTPESDEDESTMVQTPFTF